MAIDYTRSKLFWGYKITNSEPDGKIIRANLDGSETGLAYRCKPTCHANRLD